VGGRGHADVPRTRHRRHPRRPVVYATTGPAGRLSFDEAADALTAACEPVVRRAGRLGVDLLVEPVGQLRADLGFLNTLRDTIDVATAAGLGVCADLLWCWRERDLAATISRGIGAIRLVQLSDCEAAPTTMPCRLVPGDGVVELERPVSWLFEAGYAGLFDVELLGPAVDAEGPSRALARGALWTSELLDRLGVTR
jgi:sugar phosphate isomerase/epimerase